MDSSKREASRSREKDSEANNRPDGAVPLDKNLSYANQLSRGISFIIEGAKNKSNAEQREGF